MLKPLLDLLFHGNQLKRIPRSGWVMRGVPEAENVGTHTYGVAFIVLALHPYIKEENGEELLLERALSLAVIHDLAESITTDIPQPAWRKMPDQIKGVIERTAMEYILEGQEDDHPFFRLWEEAHAKESPEAKLVKDADRLDMFIQVYQYEQQFGNKMLVEFWENKPTFYYSLSEQLYLELKRLRDVDIS